MSVDVCTVVGVQIAQKPFRLTDDYVAPKGALIMPSIVAANMQASSPALLHLSVMLCAWHTLHVFKVLSSCCTCICAHELCMYVYVCVRVGSSFLLL